MATDVKKFVETYLACKTNAEVAEKLGMSTNSVTSKASQLRGLGIALPGRPRGSSGGQKVDPTTLKSELNRMIEEHMKGGQKSESNGAGTASKEEGQSQTQETTNGQAEGVNVQSETKSVENTNSKPPVSEMVANSQAAAALRARALEEQSEAIKAEAKAKAAKEESKANRKSAELKQKAAKELETAA